MAALVKASPLSLLSLNRSPLLLPLSTRRARTNLAMPVPRLPPSLAQRQVKWTLLSSKAGEQALESNAESAEEAASFEWTSVILPFLFPALGGLLFGYDIGATSGALISLTGCVLGAILIRAISPTECFLSLLCEVTDLILLNVFLLGVLNLYNPLDDMYGVYAYGGHHFARGGISIRNANEATMLKNMQSPELSGTSWYQLNAIQTGLVVSGSLYGALFGSILAFNIADILGRRRELIGAGILYVAGALFTGLASDLNMLLAGRLLYGLGIGMAMHGAPLYIAETCPPQIRGTLVSLKEAFIVLGILIGYLVGSLEISSMGGWRIMYGISAPIALLMIMGMWWLPPSPRWLLLCAVQGRASMQELKEKAVLALSRLRGPKTDIRSIELQINGTLKSIQSATEGQEEKASLADLFQGSSLKALTIGAGLVFFQQVTGQPTVLYYAASILQSAGFAAASDATRVSVVLGIFKLLMTGIAVFKVDDLGRRPLLIAGISGMVFSLFLLAGYYGVGQGYPLLAVISLLLYVSCYQVSFGPISWLMVSEIFPLRTRGRALSLAVLVNFASNAVITFAFPPIQEKLGTVGTFVGFGIVGIVSLLFVIVTVPETKGLSLEEIEAKLNR